MARPSEASGEEEAGGVPKGGANPPRVPISKYKKTGYRSAPFGLTDGSRDYFANTIWSRQKLFTVYT